MAKTAKWARKFLRSLHKKFHRYHAIQFNYRLTLRTKQVMIIVLNKKFHFAVLINDFVKFCLS